MIIDAEKKVCLRCGWDVTAEEADSDPRYLKWYHTYGTPENCWALLYSKKGEEWPLERTPKKPNS